MIQIIGSVVVVGCVVGGFLIQGGSLLLLWHPSEILIIVGSAFGAFLTRNPLKVVKDSFARAIALVKGPSYKRDDYVSLLKLLYGGAGASDGRASDDSHQSRRGNLIESTDLNRSCSGSKS